MQPMFKWALVAFVVGIVLVIWDISISRKKKEGFTAGDKQRIWGIFWLTCFISVGVAVLIWIGEDLV